MLNENQEIINKKERYVGWDCLRIILALIVFSFHANIHLNINFGIFNDFISVGALSMTGFFMLSGAVNYLGNDNLRIENGGVINYYKKRFFGIVPLYLFFMCVFFLDNPYVFSDICMLPLEVMGLQSLFLGSFSRVHNGGTWFISCLLICYFIFPLVDILIKKINTKKLILLLGLLGLLDIYAQVITGYLRFGELYSTPFLRVDQFVMGCIICAI